MARYVLKLHGDVILWLKYPSVVFAGFNRVKIHWDLRGSWVYLTYFCKERRSNRAKRNWDLRTSWTYVKYFTIERIFNGAKVGILQAAERIISILTKNEDLLDSRFG